MANEHLRALRVALCEADAGQRLCAPTELSGFSGEKLIALLQRAARLAAEREGECYLEIGVFQGLTLLSVAAAAPELPAFGIDDFSYGNPEGRNACIVEERAKSLGASNVSLIQSDFETALANLSSHIGKRRIGVFFVDGPHDYRSQLVCLLFARSYLSERAIIVVDDANYPHVRYATRDFLLANPDFKLVFEAYGPRHPIHLHGAARQAVDRGWWNGVHVLIRDSEDLLPSLLPEVPANRTRFFDDHGVHSHGFADATLELLDFANELCDLPLLRGLSRTRRLRSRLQRFRAEHPDRSPNGNTDSAALPSSRWNPGLRAEP